MGKTYSGIILKTAYERVGDTSAIEVLGKTFLDWVKLALSEADSVTVADYRPGVEIAALIKPLVNHRTDYVAVLFSDTPLITKKTVAAAVDEAYNSNKTVLKMTRGYVFEASYLLSADKIYTENTFYFDEEDFITAFSFKQVGLITDILKNRILDYHMEQGVHFTDLTGTSIGCDVSIESGVTVGAGNVITGRTRIRKGAKIGNYNVIEDCIIGEGVEIESSHAVRSSVGAGTKVGPYANLRANNVIGRGCKIGDQVELKNCKVGDGTAIGHMTYAGDVVIGAGCNVGAGVVFANFDGKDKHTTTVGDNAFIGSSSTIVAPVSIGSGSFVAAGSTITESVPPSALAIARDRQTVKPDWTGNKYTKKD